MRRLLLLVMLTTCAATVAWTTITFFGDSTKLQKNYETNETMTVDIPRLPIKAFYPWNPVGGMMHYFLTFGFQVYYLLFSMIHSNSSDVLFCSWVLFACEQLQHLKVSLIYFDQNFNFEVFNLIFLEKLCILICINLRTEIAAQFVHFPEKLHNVVKECFFFIFIRAS